MKQRGMKRKRPNRGRFTYLPRTVKKRKPRRIKQEPLLPRVRSQTLHLEKMRRIKRTC